MKSKEAWAKLQENLHDAITEAFRTLAEDLGEESFRYDQFKGMCQGYVLVTEWHGIDGEKTLDMTASTDARLWNIDGWIGWVQKDIQAQHIVNHLPPELTYGEE